MCDTLHLKEERETTGDMFIVLDLYCPDKKLPSEVCYICLFKFFRIKQKRTAFCGVKWHWSAGTGKSYYELLSAKCRNIRKMLMRTMEKMIVRELFPRYNTPLLRTCTTFYAACWCRLRTRTWYCSMFWPCFTPGCPTTSGTRWLPGPTFTISR